MKKEKKLKKKFFKVDDPVFDSGVWVFVNYTDKELHVRIKKLLKTDKDIDFLKDGKGFSGRHFVLTSDKDGDIQRIIWLREFEWTVEDIAVMAHEIIHLVMRVLEDKLIPINDDNSETVAYLYEYYIKEILRNLTPKK